MATSFTTAILVAFLQVMQTITIKVEDNTGPTSKPAQQTTSPGYSRIFVASPGIRQYNYDIAHDPEGRDFSVNFNPLDIGETDNSLQDIQGVKPQLYFQHPSPPQFIPVRYYQRQPIDDSQKYEEIHLNVKTPSHKEILKSDKEIQAVHAAYSKGQQKQPEKPMGFEPFDLGLMGYGDFMDPPDYEPIATPQPSPVSYTRKPKFQNPSYIINNNKIRFQPDVRPSLPPPPPKFSPPKKFTFPNSQDLRDITDHFQPPKLEYGFKPIAPNVDIPKPLFVPAVEDSHLKGLADKAFSKVFMAKSHGKTVPMYYTQHGHVVGHNFPKGHGHVQGFSKGHDFPKGQLIGHDLSIAHIGGHDFPKVHAFPKGRLVGHDLSIAQIGGHDFAKGLIGHDFSKTLFVPIVMLPRNDHVPDASIQIGSFEDKNIKDIDKSIL